MGLFLSNLDWSCRFPRERGAFMAIVGFIVAGVLVISILVSLSVMLRLAPVMPARYVPNMILIQAVKGLLVYLILHLTS